VITLSSVLGVEKFSIEKSDNDQVCQYVTNLLNHDLSDDGKIDLSQHQEFNWIEWTQLKKAYQDNLYVGHFDINNNHMDEGVLLWKYQWHYYDIEDIWYVNVNKVQDLEKNFMSKKFHELITESPRDGITNGFGIYPFQDDKYVTLLEKNTTQLYFVVLHPMKLNDVVYIAIFGNIESLKERDIKEGNDMKNEANGVVLIKLNPDNKIKDICFLSRKNHQPRKETK